MHKSILMSVRKLDFWVPLYWLKDTSRKFILNTKLSTLQFRAIIKVKILQEIME